MTDTKVVSEAYQNFGPKNKADEFDMESEDSEEIPREDIITESTFTETEKSDYEIPKMSFYGGSIQTTIPTKEIDIKELYDLIRSNKYKAKVLEIRSKESKTERNVLKEKLDYVNPQGIFSFRKDEGIIKSSGYAPIDIDDLGDNTIELKNKLKTDEYTTLLFVSPSGKGLKALIKIPQEIKNYESYVEAFYEYLHQKYPGIEKNTDEQTKDISRACFVSYDPEAYYNPDAELFYKKNEKKDTPQKTRTPIGDGLTLHEGQRNQGMIKLMGRWYNEIGNDEEELVRRALDWNKKHCDPPLTEAEVLVLTRKFHNRNPPSLIDKLHLTDKGNAMRLEKVYGNDLKYCNHMKRWFIYDGHKWLEDETDKIKSYAMKVGDIIELESGRYKEESSYDPEVYENYIRWARNSENVSRINAMIDLAGVFLSSKIEDYDQNNWLFNVKNGTIDLNIENNPGGKWKIKEHSKGDMITKISNVIYDPNAKCPKWIEFLKKIFMSDQDLIDYVQKIIGYSLTGDIREDCFFIIEGGGFNGKTTFVEVMTILLGEYCQTTTVDTFVQANGPRVRNDLAKLRGARLVFGPEVGDGKKLDETVVKMLTGRENVVCRYLWQEEFTYKAKCKLIFYGNYKPEISGTDFGIWRRPRVIKFPYRFTKNEMIPKYEDILIIEELSGILNWALEGCKKWQLEGLNTPKCVEEEIEDYKAESNELTDFFAAKLYKIDQESNEQISKTELYAKYVDYCQKDIKIDPISHKSFSNKLYGMGVKSIRKNCGRFWVGIRSKSPDEIIKEGREDNDKQEESEQPKVEMIEESSSDTERDRS